MNTGMTHIEAGFALSSLVAFKALADNVYFDVEIPVEPENEYLESVNIPVYDSEDPSHLLITIANGNWTSGNLNSTTYKHFYVEAGDYSSSVMTLTADGTENDRRSMSLYNGNDIHPASLLEAEQANIQIAFNNADYWDIDRMSCINPPSVDRNWIYNGSSYNTINRFHLKDYYYGINILHNSNYNTIQNSYINHMTHAGRLSDNVGIAVTTADQGLNTTVIGTKIIENDIRNANDGFQLVVGSSIDSSTINYEGTIVDGNRIWNDGDIYTDGTYGEEWLDSPTDTIPNPNFELYSTDVGFDNSNGAEYMITENAIDLKAGSLNVNNPVIISNNMFWGYQRVDGTAGGSASPGMGSPVTLHYGVHHLIFTKNIILESQRIGGCSNIGDSTYSASDVEWSHNIAYKMLYSNPTNAVGADTYLWGMTDINDWNIHHNTVVDCLGERYYNFSSSVDGALVDNNLLIDCGTTNAYDVLGASDNYLYGTTTMFFLDQSGTVTNTTSSDANMEDYTFQYERYTPAPKSKTLTGVISTELSPHYELAGSEIVATEPVNPYLESVNIPTYDSGDPTHLLITEGNGNWNNTNLNSTTYKHFYIEAGTYTSRVTLTQSGSESDRRTLSLYGSADIHPASLLDVAQANTRVYFDGASYWDLDRLSNIDDPTEASMEFDNGATYNTVNRHHIKDYYYGIVLRNGCHNNTIQNSYLNHMTHAGRMSDNVGIALASSSTNYVLIENTKIINNEIRNAGDGIQLIWSSGLIDIFYDGTIIDSNNIWIDGDIYTAGEYLTDGYDPLGEYKIAEEAIDLKAGSSTSLNPVVVTNNKMWGYRTADQSISPGSDGLGTSFVGHYGVGNLRFEDNVIFDSGGVGGVTNNGIVAYSMYDTTFKNNIFYDLGNVNPPTDDYPDPATKPIFNMYVYDGSNIEFDNNTYVNVHATQWHRFETSSNAMSFSSNLMINVDGSTSSNDGATVEDNYYYNTATKFPSSNASDVIETNPSNMGDYSFQYEKFTPAPKSKTLTGVVSTATSPHYGIAGSDIVD